MSIIKMLATPSHPSELLLFGQGIIGRLAQLSCYSGVVISLRQLSRSSISPCEQVGEHHDGAGGCLASGRAYSSHLHQHLQAFGSHPKLDAAYRSVQRSQ